MAGSRSVNPWHFECFLIYPTMRRHCFVVLFLLALCHPIVEANSQDKTLNQGVIRELNLARQHPNVYAVILEELRENFSGNVCTTPDGFPLHISEGISAVDNAIRFLRMARPIAPLAFSDGLSCAAAEHVAAQASGAFGHTDFGQQPGHRISRHGTWRGSWGENVAYGESTPRDIVLALIIDNGVRSRGHRKNIFNPDFNYAGAALGPHARYRNSLQHRFRGRLFREQLRVLVSRRAELANASLVLVLVIESFEVRAVSRGR